MPAEDMGKVSPRLRATFAVASVLFVGTLAVSPVKDSLREWRGYKSQYIEFAQARPESKRLLADVQPGVDQIWIPDLNVVDRCVTCHQGITQASLRDKAVIQPFRAHPLMPHSSTAWGCSVCHSGQGAATELAEAHTTTLAPGKSRFSPTAICRHPAELATAGSWRKRRRSTGAARCCTGSTAADATICRISPRPSCAGRT